MHGMFLWSQGIENGGKIRDAVTGSDSGRACVESICFFDFGPEVASCARARPHACSAVPCNKRRGSKQELEEHRFFRYGMAEADIKSDSDREDSRSTAYSEPDVKRAREVGLQPGKIKAGVLPCCVDPETNTPYFLLGLHRSKGFCSFQGRPERSDANVFATAVREGSEELCGCLGPPQELMEKYFAPNARFTLLYDGGFAIWLGELNEAERLRILVRFFENRYANGIGKISKPEREHKRIVWCRADKFYEILSQDLNEATKNNPVIKLPEMGPHDSPQKLRKSFALVMHDVCSGNLNQHFRAFCERGEPLPRVP